MDLERACNMGLSSIPSLAVLLFFKVPSPFLVWFLVSLSDGQLHLLLPNKLGGTYILLGILPKNVQVFIVKC